MKNFKDIIENAKESGRVTVSVAGAQDREVLLSIKASQELGLANAILVGDSNLIEPMAEEIGLGNQCNIVHEPDIQKAAATAVKLVKNGEAQVLMKGLINSNPFLKAVLDREYGLRTFSMLSHLAAFEIPGQKKLVFISDVAMNISPTLEEKKSILINAIESLKAMGITRPNIALLAANEQVSEKMPVTVDCSELSKTFAKLYPLCQVEGPITMDVAASSEAAHHKGIDSKIAGNVDLFLVPSIEAGNMIAKTWSYYAGAKTGGIIIGATQPIVLCSRADSAEGKKNAIALACLVASQIKE